MEQRFSAAEGNAAARCAEIQSIDLYPVQKLLRAYERWHAFSQEPFINTPLALQRAARPGDKGGNTFTVDSHTKTGQGKKWVHRFHFSDIQRSIRHHTGQFKLLNIYRVCSR